MSMAGGITTKLPKVEESKIPVEKSSTQEVLEMLGQAVKMQKITKRGLEHTISGMRGMAKPSSYLEQECRQISMAMSNREIRQEQRRCAKALLSISEHVLPSVVNFADKSKQPGHLASVTIETGNNKTTVLTIEKNEPHTYGGFADQHYGMVTQKAFNHLKSSNPAIAFCPGVAHRDVIILGSSEAPLEACHKFRVEWTKSEAAEKTPAEAAHTTTVLETVSIVEQMKKKMGSSRRSSF